MCLTCLTLNCCESFKKETTGFVKIIDNRHCETIQANVPSEKFEPLDKHNEPDIETCKITSFVKAGVHLTPVFPPLNLV